MPNEVIEEALTRIKAAQGNIFVRVRTVANIIAGEPAVCTLELAADNRIYKNNELIFSKEIDLSLIHIWKLSRKDLVILMKKLNAR